MTNPVIIMLIALNISKKIELVVVGSKWGSLSRISVLKPSLKDAI